ncbi:hypothetical protein QZM81_04330 [Burkholderia cepacia]|uniref:Uncharacterized protein n=1 Tax=Burkholderia cepacia TaxID=292 RepID=A0AAQ0FH71_BURCE|nr:hypothetical protein [Burkholderia cepacia]MDN7855027.1 hypothetical protein [Burkholderia cepacia]RAQ15038.1 hypothetical protein DPR02_03205 [Burkholderia cepacia]
MNRAPLRSLPGGTARLRCYRADEMRQLARRRAEAKRSGYVGGHSRDRRIPAPGSPTTRIADDCTAGRIAHAPEQYEDASRSASAGGYVGSDAGA